MKRGETLEQLGTIGAGIVIAMHMVVPTIKRNSSGAIGSVRWDGILESVLIGLSGAGTCERDPANRTDPCRSEPHSFSFLLSPSFRRFTNIPRILLYISLFQPRSVTPPPGIACRRNDGRFIGERITQAPFRSAHSCGLYTCNSRLVSFGLAWIAKKVG